RQRAGLAGGRSGGPGARVEAAVVRGPGRDGSRGSLQRRDRGPRGRHPGERGRALFRHARRVTELAARHRLPAMYPFRLYTEVGGLMSHSADLAVIWRRAAFFVDKSLRGARPADLPVEQPTKFELVINMKAARALGLTV